MTRSGGTSAGQSSIRALRDRLAALTEAKKAIEGLKIATRALAYYAREENWKEDDWGCKAVIVTPDYGEGGKTARSAIKRIEKALR